MAFAALSVLFFAFAATVSGGKGGSKACAHTGFYSKKVVPLCEKHYPDESSKHVWVIQFYHPYVQENFLTKQAFEDLASAPEKIGGAKVGAVDCQQNGDFCAKHGIRKAPTTRVIQRSDSREFQGEHNTKALQAFVHETTKMFVEAAEALDCKVKGVFTDAKKDAAVPLCTKKFPPSLDTFPWLVAFYESGNVNKDKTMRSVMNKLAEKFGNAPPKKVDAKKKPTKIRVGAVECTDQSGCDELGITSFPAVRFYRKGADPVDFDSFFDREEVQKFADAQLKLMPKPEVVEVLKADMPESDSAKASAGGEL
eukprot:TRINITY_DN23672_c0_g1_i1.p1 TRINITY_DN23672_c0_g1~~TRINITY_DN23672_c0_g1_i1.p1  ORF type:complete len:327 (+),score=82.90 TRINITY_DN23672_c0_g1_i1:54-983(+)